MKNQFFWILSLVFLFFSFPLFAQEDWSAPSTEAEESYENFEDEEIFTGEEEPLIPEKRQETVKVEAISPSVPQAEALFLVNNITYYINGQTKTWAIEHLYKIKERTRFTSEQEMQNYFKGKERWMLDNKIFSQVHFSYTTELVLEGEVKEPVIVEGRQVHSTTPVYAVHLFVQIQDSITQIILPPLPRIVQDDFRFSFKFTERNIGGSLMEFNFDGNFSFDINNSRHTFLPNWRAGASLGGIRFPGYEQAFWISASYDYSTVVRNDSAGNKSIEYDFNDLYIGIGSGVTILPNFSYGYSLSNSFRFANNFYVGGESNDAEIIRQDLGVPKGGIGYNLRWSHSLTYSTITDSIVKMRKGYSFSLSNNIGYNFGTKNVTSDISWGATFFQPLANDFIELSMRYVGFWDILQTERGIDYIRGVRSSNAWGFLGNYINTTFLFTFWRWPKVWEAQIGLFLDAGVSQKLDTRDLKNKRIIPVSWNDFDAGMGIEGRLHLHALRSFVIYGRLGVDLKRMPGTLGQIIKFWGDKYDFTIGFGTHY